MKLEIETYVGGKEDTYKFFFNYGLKINTWRMFVNKQILMRYERLFIEKQLNEVNTEKRKLESEIFNVQENIERVRK